ncbi:hypothetical protein BDN72DRAFT_959222 [Pluteus cervinus]|uniref:Uncharacterized protein n=1 Tax=Pluteus cervinus TaxID=181527 RepID=A0ACD3AW26_9AGAR|nr:hypothetical protein BDN72DRAFT_959222 [Pluteus cervinus]
MQFNLVPGGCVPPEFQPPYDEFQIRAPPEQAHELPYCPVDPKEFAEEVSASGRVLKDTNRIFVATIKELRSTSSGYGRRKLRLITFFQTLPLDVVECIFGFLHPLDLHHLVRTSKSLRKLLLSRSSNSIWETSFLNHPSVPYYPEKCSPPFWTDLLYGCNPTCSFCENYAFMIDLVHLHRICRHCASVKGGRNYLPGTSSEFEVSATLRTIAQQLNLKSLLDEHFSETEIVPSLLTPSFLLQLNGKAYFNLNYASSGSWVGVYDENCSTYLKIMEPAWRNEEGGRDEAEKYLDSRTAAVGRVKEQNLLYFTWARQLYETIEGQERYVHPAAWITQRFVNMGYLYDDLKDPRMTVWFVQLKLHPQRYITRTGWTRICKSVQPTLQLIKDERLWRERKRAHGLRKEAFSQVYRTYVSSLHLSQIPLTPTAPLFMNEDGIQSIQLEFLAWQEARIAEVAAEVRRCYPKVFNTTGKGNVDHPAQKLDNKGVLGLAISAFRCNSCSVIEKSEPLLARYRKMHLRASGSPKAVQRLHLTVLELGLDPFKTTASELDSLDARFVCGNCPITGKSSGRKALTWRGCIYHQCNETSDGNDPPKGMSWLQLSPAAAASVKRREIPNLSGMTWAIKRHIRSQHHIAKPLIRRHFLNRCSPLRKYFPARLYESTRSLANCKCSHCPPERTRLFVKKSLTKHLRDKHQLLEMKEEDYQVVDLFVK